MATQKALEEIQQHKHYLHQKQQEIAHRRQLQQQALNDHHETGRVSVNIIHLRVSVNIISQSKCLYPIVTS